MINNFFLVISLSIVFVGDISKCPPSRIIYFTAQEGFLDLVVHSYCALECCIDGPVIGKPERCRVVVNLLEVFSFPQYTIAPCRNSSLLPLIILISKKYGSIDPG